MKSIAIVGATLGLILSQSVARADPPASSAYVTDPQNSYVEDATSRGIGQVNMITCIMAALRPDALVNDGPYNALVDQTKCDPNARSSARETPTTAPQASVRLVTGHRRLDAAIEFRPDARQVFGSTILTARAAP